MRDEERRLGRLEVGIVEKRLLDEVVERLRMKEGPPVGRNVAAGSETLRFAAWDTPRGLGRLRWTWGIGRDRGSRRPLEIRADHAGGRQERREQRERRQPT